MIFNRHQEKHIEQIDAQINH
uniref:Uncharacterized protein n=1 Tax=Arundo donax TaxID=35708 RepID=A0A0A8Z3E2_ARUDO